MVYNKVCIRIERSSDRDCSGERERRRGKRDGLRVRQITKAGEKIDYRI